jgi:hypothetical protein
MELALNWDAVGAIGEIVGAAAVVLTLLYLARQTRKNAQALDATSTREFGYRLSEWHRAVAQDPELKRISLKSVQLEMEDFSAAEWWEFRMLAVSIFLIYQTAFVHMSLNLGSREESENYMRTAKGLLDSFPAYRRFWEEEASVGTFTQGFINAINAATSAPNFDYAAEAKISSDND